jgi:ABC-2 type transport system permease protein
MKHDRLRSRQAEQLTSPDSPALDAAPARRSRVAQMSWLRVWTVARRQFYVMWRSPPRWFDLTVWPVVDILVWGALGAYVAQENEASRAGTPYLLAGIMLFHVLYQSQISVATGFMEETWSRNLLNVMTTPVREVEYALGLALYGFVKLVLGMVAVLLAALIFFGFNLASVGWGLVPIAAVLMLAGWAGAQLVIGLLLRFGPSAEILAWGTLFVVMALSGVFNPVETLPGALEPLARLLPTTHAFSAARTVLDGDPLPWDAVAKGFVGAVVVSIAALAFVVHMLAVFRRRGYVTRFS